MATVFAALAAAAAAGGAFYYAGIAASQLTAMNNTYGEMQQQTKLIRQQLIGTQAAVLVIGDTPGWNNQIQKLIFQLTNSGQLIGKLNHFDAIIQRKSLPAQNLIGEPIKVHTENQEVSKNQTVLVPTTLPWLLPELKDNDPSWPGGEFVTVDGSYSYDNGFGDTIEQKFCFIWISPWNQTMLPPKVGAMTGGGWHWGQGNQPCRTVKELMTEYAAAKRFIKEASVQTKKAD